MKNLNLILAALAFSNVASAVNIDAIGGERISHTSPNGKSEACIMTRKLLPDTYSAENLAKEKELCEMDFYTTSAICPKLNSTNPGLLAVEILAGKTRAQTMEMCKNKDALTTEAKFKSSISCSYTPSILAYYHFSNMLATPHVPVATLRTMDRIEHKKIVDAALKILAGKAGDVIHQTWSTFLSQHAKLDNDKIFDNTRNFVYGAFSENPRDEYQYVEVSGGGPYDTRYQRFIGQPPYVKLTSAKSVKEIAGSDVFNKIAPVLVQMKDVSDMILLDVLFNQDDRIGNIHFDMSWYMIEGGEIKRVKSNAKLAADKKSWVIPEEEKAIQASGAVLIRDMLMKDNDCGVDVSKRSNQMRKVSALENIRHMSARTYSRFMNFYKTARSQETLDWMRNELLFTPEDLGTSRPVSAKSFLSNLDFAYNTLKAKCKAGSLALDLNLEDYVPGSAPMTTSCE